MEILEEKEDKRLKQSKIINSCSFFYKELGLTGAKVSLHFKEFENIYFWGYAGEKLDKDGLITYHIFINDKCDLYQSISTAAHEMVHVKQYFTKDLSIKNGAQSWKGIRLSWLPYVFRPWEIEAFYKEAKLFNKYFDKYISHTKCPKPSMQFKINLYINAFYIHGIAAVLIFFAWVSGSILKELFWKIMF